MKVITWKAGWFWRMRAVSTRRSLRNTNRNELMRWMTLLTLSPSYSDPNRASISLSASVPLVLNMNMRISYPFLEHLKGKLSMVVLVEIKHNLVSSQTKKSNALDVLTSNQWLKRKNFSLLMQIQ